MKIDRLVVNLYNKKGGYDETLIRKTLNSKNKHNWNSDALINESLKSVGFSLQRRNDLRLIGFYIGKIEKSLKNLRVRS